MVSRKKNRSTWKPPQEGWYKKVETGARARIVEGGFLSEEGEAREAKEFREARQGLIDFFVIRYCDFPLEVIGALFCDDVLSFKESLLCNPVTIDDQFNVIIDFFIKSGQVRTDKFWNQIRSDWPGAEEEILPLERKFRGEV